MADLILVRPMTREMYITLAVIAAVTSAGNAADEPSFAAAAAKSADQFNSGKGGQYGIAFMKNAGKALYQAAQGCRDSGARPGAYHDVVFIVSASGHINQTIHGQRSAYGDCVTAHLRMPKAVAKPPSDSWPIQVRFVHGSLRRDQHPAFMIVADDAASETRNGSTRERAVLNNQPVATHMQWEYRYLDEHFPGRKPIDHRIDSDATTQRVWSVFTFTWHGKKVKFWFDVTEPFNEFRRKENL